MALHAGNTLNWFISYLDKRYQTCKVNNVYVCMYIFKFTSQPKAELRKLQ